MGTYGPNGTNGSFCPGDLPFKLSYVRSDTETLLSSQYREIGDTRTHPLLPTSESVPFMLRGARGELHGWQTFFTSRAAGKKIFNALLRSGLNSRPSFPDSSYL